MSHAAAADYCEGAGMLNAGFKDDGDLDLVAAAFPDIGVEGRGGGAVVVEERRTRSGAMKTHF